MTFNSTTFKYNPTLNCFKEETLQLLNKNKMYINTYLIKTSTSFLPSRGYTTCTTCSMDEAYTHTRNKKRTNFKCPYTLTIVWFYIHINILNDRDKEQQQQQKINQTQMGLFKDLWSMTLHLPISINTISLYFNTNYSYKNIKHKTLGIFCVAQKKIKEEG